MKKRAGYTPEKTLLRRSRAKELGLCLNCYVNPRHGSKTRCVKCLESAKRRTEKLALNPDPEKSKKKYQQIRKWQIDNPEKRRAQVSRYRAKLRKTVFDHYGRQCSCPGCDVKEEKWLSIDHINGGGTRHREEIGRGSTIYAWLVKHNFPDGFQVLCFNCNLAKGFYGKCPHEEK